MTLHQPIRDPAQAVVPAPKTSAHALPLAPLAMPKQVLTHDRGLLQRLGAAVLARIGWGKPRVRRAS